MIIMTFYVFWNSNCLKREIFHHYQEKFECFSINNGFNKFRVAPILIQGRQSRKITINRFFISSNLAVTVAVETSPGLSHYHIITFSSIPDRNRGGERINMETKLKTFHPAPVVWRSLTPSYGLLLYVTRQLEAIKPGKIPNILVLPISIKFIAIRKRRETTKKKHFQVCVGVQSWIWLE